NERAARLAAAAEAAAEAALRESARREERADSYRIDAMPDYDELFARPRVVCRDRYDACPHYRGYGYSGTVTVIGPGPGSRTYGTPVCGTPVCGAPRCPPPIVRIPPVTTAPA